MTVGIVIDVMLDVVIIEDVLDDIDVIKTGGGVVEHFLSLPHVRPGQQPVTVVAVGPR